MRSATALLRQSFLLAFRRVFRDEGEEDHLNDQRDHRGQDAAYRIAEEPEEGHEHQCGVARASNLYSSTMPVRSVQTQLRTCGRRGLDDNARCWAVGMLNLQ
jgi:hypothetical protein